MKDNPHEPLTGPAPRPAEMADVAPVALAIGDGREDWMLPDEVFEETGCQLLRATDTDQASESCTTGLPDLVFLPLTLDGKPTTDQLRRCLSRQPEPVVVVVASNDQIDIAAEAMRLGAYDCLFRPFSRARLARTIRDALKQRGRRQQPVGPAQIPPSPPNRRQPRMRGPRAALAQAREALTCPPLRRGIDSLNLAQHGFVATSAPMQAVLRRADAVARSDAPVFISGETGTGKSWLAEIIHDLSPHAAHPLVTVACAGLTPETLDAAFLGPAGALARAAGGALYLDEIDDLSPAVQPRLLRLLERIETGIGTGAAGQRTRVIASTSLNPRAATQTGRIRPDLYYRLHVAPLDLPPLRAREGDAVQIARTRLAAFSEAEGRGFTGFSAQALSLIAGYDWPGNLRELVNVIRSVVLLNQGPLVTPEMLPAELRAGGRPGADTLPRGGGGPTPAQAGRSSTQRGRAEGLVGMTLAEIERAVIEATIDAESGSLPRAARVLGVSPSTLYRKRDAWGKAASKVDV